MNPYRTASPAPKPRCPNCNDELPEPPVYTPTGIRVCDGQCVTGWMNGERHLEYLKTVRDLNALISPRPSGMDGLIELGCYWAEFFKKLQAEEPEPDDSHRKQWGRWGWSGVWTPLKRARGDRSPV